MKARLVLALALLLAAAFGCGLLEDATTFSIDTGWKTVTVDSDALGVTIPSGSVIPAVPCSSANDICAQATSGVSCNAQTYGCKIQCGSGGKCEILANAEIGETVDISQKVQSQTSASALSKVSFNYMLYKVEQNTLTFDTPEITVYVGPNTANTTADSGVVKFATIDSIPKGQTPDGQLPATSAGKTALSEFVKNYKTPFKFFVKADLRFPSGSPLPKGKLSLKVNGYFQIEAL